MKWIYATLFFTLLLVGACSGDDSEEQKSHVWKEQTDTMDKARAVEGVLQDAANAERKMIEEQAQ